MLKKRYESKALVPFPKKGQKVFPSIGLKLTAVFITPFSKTRGVKKTFDFCNENERKLFSITPLQLE
jgi:hypothetical protein